MKLFKTPEQKLILFLQEMMERPPMWFGATANTTYFENSLYNRQWTFHDEKKHVWGLAISPTENDEVILQLHRNQKILLHHHFDQTTVAQLTNPIFDQIVAFELEKRKEHALTPPDSQLSSDPHAELRSLEWLKTSLALVKKALEQTRNQKETLFQGQFFGGQYQNLEQLRLILFSFDLNLSFKDQGLLEVQAFNHRPGQKSLAPDLQGQFIHQKSPLLDQIIQILELAKPSFHL